MNKYQKYFDSVSPYTSDKDFAENVVKSAKIPKRNLKKMIISLSAAAAAVMTLTITVSAVVNWDIGAAVRSFFGDKNNITENNIVDVNVTNIENTFDCLDISVKGAVRDENFTVIFLDVQRTDGDIFDCAPYAIKDSGGNSITMPEYIPVYEFAPKALELTYIDENGRYAGIAESLSYRQYVVKDGSDMDGHITQAVCIDTSDPFFGMAEDGLICDKVKLELGGFKGKKCGGKYSDSGKYIMLDPYSILDMNGRFSCEIDLGSCVVQSRSAADLGTVSVKAYSHTSDPSEMEFKNFDFDVKNINVTSVSVSVRLEGGIPEKTFYVNTNDFGSIVMNDGREIFFGNYTLPEIIKEGGNMGYISADSEDDKWTFDAGFILPETVDIEDIRSIKINGTEFMLE